jgi:hypothetical protein
MIWIIITIIVCTIANILAMFFIGSAIINTAEEFNKSFKVFLDTFLDKVGK